MNCPKCQASMETVAFGDMDVDRCTGCQGIWFDLNEAEHLKTADGSEAIDTGDPKVGKAHDAESHVDCPRCHTRMIRMTDLDQPHLHYEGCTVCYGLYFDAGEFRDFKEQTVADRFRDAWLILKGQTY